MWAHLLAALLGAWLCAAPAVLRYEGSPLEFSDRIAGPLVATFGIVAMAQSCRAVRFVNVVLGAWIVLSPWMLSPGDIGPALHALLVGGGIAALSLVRGRLTLPYGGGWRSLWRPGLRRDRSPQPERSRA